MAEPGRIIAMRETVARLWRKALSLLASALCLAGVVHFAAAAEEPNPAASPRQLYNDGTRKLHEGKLQEAEACLQGAVASQNARVQPPALYNLGETRFFQGAEDLKKGPKGDATAETANHAADNADSALHAAGDALANEDVTALVSAYLEGRGARKTLRGAIQAVKAALDNFGSVLTKWQRASGDFKSAVEMSPADADAKTNAQLVDRNIAALIDQQRLLMQAMAKLGKKREELGKKMAEMKKRMPSDEGQKLSGKGGDEDEDEEEGGRKPPEFKEGAEEPAPKNGTQMLLTSEEAARLLDMLKLDANRKLSISMDDTGKPADHKGRDW